MADDSTLGTAIEHVITVDGVTLEAVTDLPDGEPTAVALVTHPHPRMGGDLSNPVPAGVARGLAGAGVAVLRINFRGTGRSTGEHDGGDAERLDVSAALQAAAGWKPGLPVHGVGYSFGADVLLGTDLEATGVAVAGIVVLAPPLRVFDADVLQASRASAPTLILSPEHDQFCPPDVASQHTAAWPDTTVESVAGTDHFFAGALDAVVSRIVQFARAGG